MRVDRDLVREVEASSARSTASYVGELAAVTPSSGASVEWFDGSAFVSLGPGRYVNRAIGIGLGDAPGADVLDALERFFTSRNLPASAEVSPWVSADFLAESRHRGYGLDWFRNVLAHDLVELPPRSPALTTREVDEETYAEWQEIISGEAPPGSAARTTSDEFCDARHRAPGSMDLIGSLDARCVATGSYSLDGDLAWLGGAATRESARGCGAQSAVIADRRHRVRDAGARLALVTAVSDGVSARNLLASGFQLLYTQVVLTRTLQ
jgi:hypothetical protein